MAGASIETTLELWASSLRNVKVRMRPLFTQERVAASAGLFLDGLLGSRGQAPWSDEAVLGKIRVLTLPLLEKHGPVEAWIVDDTGFPKKGKHSVGVARQYCGQLGKQDNCQTAVSLSIANRHGSLPIAYRLYLPKEWAGDEERRQPAS